MRRKARTDPDFKSFLLDYASSTVFRPGSAEARLVRIVAQRGLSALNFNQMELWYERVLPTLSKPLGEQVAISSIMQNGGYVPPRIDPARPARATAHPYGVDGYGLDVETPDDLASIARALREGV
jgi:hypothetical protein